MTSILDDLDAPDEAPITRRRAPERRRRWVWVLGCFITLLVLGLVSAAVVVKEAWKDNTVSIQETVSFASPDDLEAVARTRVFFGHQAVGEDVLSGVSAVFAKQGISMPPIVGEYPTEGEDGGFIEHRDIGENEHPLRKIEDFDKLMRSGIANHVDVAAMKFSYVDVFADTDAQTLFDRYRLMIDGVRRDYPHLRIMHVTMPLMTEGGRTDKVKQEVKGLLGKQVRFGQAENVIREDYNAMLRHTYGDDVFDLAAAESTTSDGHRTAHVYKGDLYFTLNSQYASDSGHLNQVGSEVAADAFLAAIARVVRGSR